MEWLFRPAVDAAGDNPKRHERAEYNLPPDPGCAEEGPRLHDAPAAGTNEATATRSAGVA
ncbi:MAG: hypothetical protein ACOZDY_15635 [Pseudomonadota bacterium]